MATLNKALARCQARGIRLTPKRQMVLSCLLSADRPLSAYEIVEVCQAQQGQVIPVMSVYRILAFLSQHELVHKLQLTKKYLSCSHIACEHSHQPSMFLVCNTCERVKEVTINPDIIEKLSHSAQQASYQINTEQLELNCLCEQCAA